MTHEQDTTDPSDASSFEDRVYQALPQSLQEVQDEYFDDPARRQLMGSVVTNAARLALDPHNSDTLADWHSAQDALMAFEQSQVDPTDRGND